MGVWVDGWVGVGMGGWVANNRGLLWTVLACVVNMTFSQQSIKIWLVCKELVEGT